MSSHEIYATIIVTGIAFLTATSKHFSEFFRQEKQIFAQFAGLSRRGPETIIYGTRLAPREWAFNQIRLREQRKPRARITADQLWSPRSSSKQFIKPGSSNPSDVKMQDAIAEPSDALPWTRVASEVNAWRGACIQSFAQAESAVTETLLFLSDAGDRGKAVQLRHLVGQRLEDLACALGPGGGFAAEGVAASKMLAEFRAYEGLRTHLAHDVARIAIERNGKWVVVFRHLSIRTRAAERRTMAFEQPEAIATLQRLKRTTQQLDAALGNLRRAIAIQNVASSG